MTDPAPTARAQRLVLDDDVELHWHSEGQGEPLVLVHGGMGDWRSWQHQVMAFATRYRVLTYSRRYSDPNRNRLEGASHSVEIEARDLAGLQHVLGLGPAHFVGTSYGASTALLHAIAAPRAVRSLVLAEPPLHHWARDEATAQPLYQRFMADVWVPAAGAFAAGDAATALHILTDGIAGRPLWECLDEGTRAARLRNARSMQALVQADEPFGGVSRAAVAALSVPVLVLRGAFTSPLHRWICEELVQVLPGAVDAVIENAGHGAAAENPKAFDEAVLAFLCR